MPKFYLKSLTDLVLLWSKLSDDQQGNPTVNAPVQIKVRWEDSEFQDNAIEGNPLSFQPQVFTDPCDGVKLGDILWQGILSDYKDLTGTELENLDLYEVSRISRIKNIKGRVSLHSLTLTRYKGKVPTVVN